MNLFGIFCCREKSKPPLPKKVITTNLRISLSQEPHMIRDRKISFLEPNSDPYTMKDKYKGEKLGDVPNGNGEMMYKNGDYYRGEWVNGEKEGRGVQIYNQKGYQYQGEWKENVQNGHGKITHDNGSFYVGQFKDNQKHGKGEFHDFQKKQLYQQFYENGVLKKQKAKQIAASKQQEFPTLVLDKERFNSEDLQVFQKQNPEIKQLQVNFLTKYYSICKIINLPFIKKNIKEWDDKEVRQFLQAIDLSHCNEIFYTNKIKGTHLITITEKQMKEDLNLKLGDRKRLLNFCKYLASIYNLDKNAKKKKDAKKGLHQKRSMPSKMLEKSTSDRYLNAAQYKTANIEDIIEEESNKESFENSDRSSQFRKRKQNKKQTKKENYKEDYETDQHSLFYSNQILENPNKPPRRQSRNIPKSQTSSSSEQLELSAVRNTASMRKKSSDNADDEFHGVKNLVYKKGNVPNYIDVQNQLLAIEADHSSHSDKHSHNYDHSDKEDKSLRFIDNSAANGHNAHHNSLHHGQGVNGNGNHNNANGNGNHKKNNKKNNKESSSDSATSESSIEIELVRKRTTNSRANREGGMQIRELYEFLKERGNLEFIIKSKEIQILELIGEGGYGKVYKGKYMSCPVAVKDYIKTGKHQNQEDFLKELEILSGLKHPNIVLYMGICITTDKYQLVTQYLEYGSLFDQIHKKKKKFTKDEILEIVDDMVKGMVYLHSMKNIMHRDLKSSNVLIDEDWKVKLCDFGLSGHKKKSKKKNQNRIGTYQWMAPEVMKKEEMDFFSDVYSFGVIIWELLSNKIPYEGYTEAQIIGEVGYDQSYKLPLEEDSMWTCDDFMVQLMYECLSRVPSERPTFIQIQSKINSYFQMIEEVKNKSRSV